MNGIFLLDKPLGISSNAALQKVKWIFKNLSTHRIKAGHTGSLDPLATGLLPICLGDATKFSQYLLDSDKTYAVTMKLGIRTTTSDAEGDIISTRNVPPLTLPDINTAFDFFRGETQQIPSMFSALKHNGIPLYDYARRGIEIQRPSRKIIIYQLDVLNYQNHNVEFTVKCSKGTYVRTLVDDLGERLNCGAHVTQLRRLAVGPFDASQMMTIEQLTQIAQDHPQTIQTVLLSVDTAVSHWPAMIFSESMVMRLQQGQTVIAPECIDAPFVRLKKEDHTFFGVAQVIDQQKIVPQRLINLN